MQINENPTRSLWKQCAYLGSIGGAAALMIAGIVNGSPTVEVPTPEPAPLISEAERLNRQMVNAATAQRREAGYLVRLVTGEEATTIELYQVTDYATGRAEELGGAKGACDSQERVNELTEALRRKYPVAGIAHEDHLNLALTTCALLDAQWAAKQGPDRMWKAAEAATESTTKEVTQ
ncbi:hypothetical protein [Aeromonas veronii]|uniref:hypothetical protein n=1 Tax=Aeromonas veronii TaxID=654 RepID=UPI0032EF6E61